MSEAPLRSSLSVSAWALFELGVASGEGTCLTMNLSCPPVILRFATFDDLNPVSNGEAEIAFSLKREKQRVSC
jgi:hypothetical protein